MSAQLLTCLHVKQAGNERRITVEDVDVSSTVLELKRRLEAPCGFPAEGMRLIFKGRVLSDSSALHTYAVDNECTLHLVRSAQSVSSPPPPAPMAAAALPSDPMAGAMLASLTSNPELLRSLLRSNPQTAAMMDTNPELAQALSDPDTLRRALELQNPATRDEAMRVADRQLANVEGGFNALAHMYSEMERSGMTEASTAANPFASLFAAQAGATSAPAPAPRGEPNAAPLPNPWAPAPAAPAAAATAAPPLDLFGGALGGLDGGGAFGAPPGGALGGFGGGGFGAPHGADPLEHLSSIMEDPAMGPAMSAMLSNPAVLETMLATNPALQTMLNPANIRSMRQMQQSMGGSGFGAMGGGAIGGAAPWMAGAPGSLFGAGANPFAVPAQPQEPPEVLYASQLAQLRGMGFYDEAQNLRILAVVNGNVSAAVERLLSQPF